MRIGFTGIVVYVNEGVQVKQHPFPWDDIAEEHRPGGEKWSGVVTDSGVQFLKRDGTLIWFPRENITRVEATRVA